MQKTQEQLTYDSFKTSFNKLSPEQQAGCLIWPSVGGYELTPNEITLLEEIKPSGIVLFKRNFSDVTQSKQLVDSLKTLCTDSSYFMDKSFIIAADEEGGRVSRLPLPEKSKPVYEFTLNQDKSGLAKQLQMQIRIADEIGINCFLSPVLDIFTEPQNKVIGDRSFGKTADEVCEYAQVVFDILTESNILTCGKHFPGHGDTKEDSHFHAAISNADERTLKNREWKPFQYFIKQNIPMIMAAHVILPNLTQNKSVAETPATLNFYILTEILREKLGFKGLILSDDLRMKAIEHYCNSKGIYKNYLEYASIEALNAGCDILLSCHSIEEEKIIIDAIAGKLQNSEEFVNMCCEKAYRQHLIFSSYFTNHEEKAL